MRSGRSDFPTPEDKGGSKVAESPVWEQRAHLAQVSAHRYCSNMDSTKIKPKACGVLFWGFFNVIRDPCTHLALQVCGLSQIPM